MHMRKSVLLFSIFSLATVTIIGCSKPASSVVATKTQAKAPGAPAVPGPPSGPNPWAPDADAAKLYTQVAKVGNYEFLLSKDLVAKPLPKVPDTIKIGVFAGNLTGTEDMSVLSISIMKEAKLVQELSTGKPGRAITDYTAGFGKSAGIRIVKTEQVEKGQLDGIDFERMKWQGGSRDNVPMNGITYAAVVGDQAFIITAHTSDKNANGSLRIMEKMISTLKKQ